VQLHLSAARGHAAGHIRARERGERGGGALALALALASLGHRTHGGRAHGARLVDAGGDAGEGAEVELVRVRVRVS